MIKWMTIINMIRGTNHDQDARFSDKTKNMLIKSTWPDKYDTKVDLKKVDYELIKMWVQKKVAKLLGEEDDITSGTIISHLDESLEKDQKLNAKQLHVAVSGVLQDKTLTFMSEFWDILDEAQRSSRGIPECLVEEKKKSEEEHRKKLEELQNKRHKMNVNRFNQNMRDNDRYRDRYDDYKDKREYREYREYQSHKKKKNKHKSRSRSRSPRNRQRGRSKEKKRRDRSRQKQSKKHKHRKSRYESASPPPRKASKRVERQSEVESDSSGVVSSSSQGY